MPDDQRLPADYADLTPGVVLALAEEAGFAFSLTPAGELECGWPVFDDNPESPPDPHRRAHEDHCVRLAVELFGIRRGVAVQAFAELHCMTRDRWGLTFPPAEGPPPAAGRGSP